nr:ORF 10 [Haemophilus phage HP1]
MVTISSISPLVSTKLKPNSFCAPLTPAKKALYFVPASLPLIVACKLPNTPNCSATSIFAAFAAAPNEVNAALIPSPEVLNIFTARAVCPAILFTQFAFPSLAASSAKIPYMVPI